MGTTEDYGQNGTGANTDQTSLKSNNWLDYAGDIMKLWEAYQKNRDKNLSFQQVPLSPEQKALYDRAIKTFDTLPTAQTLGPMAMQVLQGYNGMGFKAPDSVSIPKFGIQGAAGYRSGGTQIDYSKMAPYWKTGSGGQQKPNGGANHIQTNVSGGRFQPLMRDTDSIEEPSDRPHEGETIADYLWRVPGGTPQRYLPNGGQGSTAPGDSLPGGNNGRMAYGDFPQSVHDGLGKLWQFVTASGGGWEAIMAFDPTGITRALNVPIEIAQGIYNLIHRGAGGRTATGGGSTSGGGTGTGGRAL